MSDADTSAKPAQTARKTVFLKSEQELRILMLPLRQRLLKTMRVFGRPMTAKELSTVLDITPSSAAHHLRKLQSLGIVEFDHSVLVNGITANYMRLAPVTVSLFSRSEPGAASAEVMTQTIVSEELEGYLSAMRPLWEQPLTENFSHRHGDLLSGVLHLTADEAAEVMTLIRRFLDTHDERREDTTPWSYLLLCHPVQTQPPEEETI